MSSYTHIPFPLSKIKPPNRHRHKIATTYNQHYRKSHDRSTTAAKTWPRHFPQTKEQKGIISIKSPLRYMMESTAGKLTAVNDTLKQQETNNVHQVDPRRALEPSQQRQERS